MFDTALSGQPVILADPRMTAADEQAGRLVHLNPLTVERPHGIHIVTDSRNADPRIDLFAEWLKRAARAPD